MRKLLDLFCGAGGASVGYARAGFEVVGVDLAPQPRYPFEFVQADALDVLALLAQGSQGWTASFDVVHASPPCQSYSATRTLHTKEHPMLIEEVRRLLRESGRTYVIENVVGAPLLSPALVCGSAFDLPIRRHRLFESSEALWSTQCSHAPKPIDVTGGGYTAKPRTDGKGGRSNKPRTLEEARAALGIDWMNRAELNQAIPPAYTQFIGGQL